MQRERRSGEDTAVSPVIAVVLMVAITVIISVVVSAFALTLAEDKQDSPIRAAVSVDVDTVEESVTIQTNSMGNAEFVVIRGDIANFGDYEPFLNDTGQQVTLYHEPPSNPGQSDFRQETGTINVVAIQGTLQFEQYAGAKSNIPTAYITPVTAQTTVREVEYDFS